MPANTPAQLFLRSFVFQYLDGVVVQNRDAYLSEGVQKIKIGTLMLGGAHFFCASHARWRCHLRLFQPLCGQNACFAHGVTDWHSHARWRSLFSVLPVLGGVAIFNFCNPSAAGKQLLFIWNSVAFPCCMPDYMFFIIIETNSHMTARAWPHDRLLKQS